MLTQSPPRRRRRRKLRLLLGALALVAVLAAGAAIRAELRDGAETRDVAWGLVEAGPDARSVTVRIPGTFSDCDDDFRAWFDPAADGIRASYEFHPCLNASATLPGDMVVRLPTEAGDVEINGLNRRPGAIERRDPSRYPRLVGLPVHEARAVLEANGTSIGGMVSTVDGQPLKADPRGPGDDRDDLTVTAQRPAAHETIVDPASRRLTPAEVRRLEHPPPATLTVG